jgi:hypothetical protein
MSRSSRAVLSLLLASAATGCLDTTLDVSYPTMAAAVSDGAVTRGWIPAWLPANATDLHEVHDLDSNESALSFGVPASTRLALPSTCQPVQLSDTLPVRFSRSWWPTAAELERSYTFYSCSAEFVGLHKSGRRALHWHTNTR